MELVPDKEVDAVRSIIMEIKECQKMGSRTLPVQLNDNAIPWVAKEIFHNLPDPLPTMEEFMAHFREEVIKDSESTRSSWKYFASRERGDVGVILMPSEKSVYFDLVLDERGERIVSYRYLKWE